MSAPRFVSIFEAVERLVAVKGLLSRAFRWFLIATTVRLRRGRLTVWRKGALEESNGGRLPRKPRCCPHARTAVPWRVEHDPPRHEQPVPCIGLGMEMRVAGEVVEWSVAV